MATSRNIYLDGDFTPDGSVISYYNRPNNHRASGESDCGSVLRGMSTCTARKQDLIDLICLYMGDAQSTWGISCLWEA